MFDQALYSYVESRLDFQVFFRTWRPYVAGLARIILGSVDEVEDVVQNVFLIAHTRLHELRDRKALKAWIATVTVREAQLALRRRRRCMGVEITCDAADLERGDPSSEGRLEQHLMAEGLAKAVEKLPPEERCAWSLRVQGRSLEQVSIACGCSLATTKRRISEARKKLRAFLSPEPNDPREPT